MCPVRDSGGPTRVTYKHTSTGKEVNQTMVGGPSHIDMVKTMLLCGEAGFGMMSRPDVQHAIQCAHI